MRRRSRGGVEVAGLGVSGESDLRTMDMLSSNGSLLLPGHLFLDFLVLGREQLSTYISLYHFVFGQRKGVYYPSIPPH